MNRAEAATAYDRFQFKTPPLGKQRDAVRESWHEPIWAILGRPGTGKTKMCLDTASLLYAHQKITAALIVCPNEVHKQWWKEGVPRHCSVPTTGGAYSSTMGKQTYEHLRRNLRGTDALRFLAISFEGLQTVRGRGVVKEFMAQNVVLCTDDESHRTSNPRAAVYKALKPVMRAAKYRRIMTGTLFRQNPYSAWGQFELMGPSLLGDATYASFKRRYAEMLPDSHWLVKRLQMQFAEKTGYEMDSARVKSYVPAVEAKDADGKPIFKNLGALRKRLEVYSSFLTLADVAGQEPILLQQTREITLTAEQQRHYDRLVKYGVADAPGGQLTADGALALATRLAQCVGGFLPSDDDPQAQPIGDRNPKLEDLLAWLEEVGPSEKVIIWAKFIPELLMIGRALRERYGEDAAVEYHGRVSTQDKAAAKQSFIHGSARYFVGQQKAAGTGTDGLQSVCSYMYFFSNDYAYLDREQAVSRAARLGGSGAIVVVDAMCPDSVDEDIVRCMQAAEDCHVRVLRQRIAGDQ